MVSICLITYNQEMYVAETIKSLLNQETTFKYNIIIGEDFSTDNTRKICEKFAIKNSKKIILLPSEKNNGMILNFIRTLKECNSEYIAFCEGDDFWTDPNKLQKQVDFLEENPDYGMVSSNCSLIDEIGTPIPDNNMIIKQRENYKPTVDFFDLWKVNHINTLTVVVRADFVKELAKRIEKENLWFVYDYWFWLNISLKSKIRVFDEKMAKYRVHSGGVSTHSDFFKLRTFKVKQDVIQKALFQSNLCFIKLIIMYFKLIYTNAKRHFYQKIISLQS